MKQRIFPLGTDSINRYHIKVTAQAHASSQWSSWKDGIPQLIGHDHQRLMGWTLPYALVFEPGRTWSFGQSFFAETDEDRTIIEQRFRAQLTQRLERESRPHETELRRLMPQAGEGAELFCAEAASLYREGLLEDVRPDLVKAVDKDGLVVVNDLDHLGSGVFSVDGLAVFAHPYFRRSYSRHNTLNGAFFDTVDILMKEGVEVRLALDPNLVGCPRPTVGGSNFILVGPGVHGRPRGHHTGYDAAPEYRAREAVQPGRPYGLLLVLAFRRTHAGGGGGARLAVGRCGGDVRMSLRSLDHRREIW